MLHKQTLFADGAAYITLLWVNETAKHSRVNIKKSDLAKARAQLVTSFSLSYANLAALMRFSCFVFMPR